MTETKKQDSCWTEEFQDHISRAVLLPKIKFAITRVDKKPQDLNELHKTFCDFYKVKITKKYFLKSCKILGLEFETKVEIKTKNLEIATTYPPESDPVVYNSIPQTPQGPSTNFDPSFGGIVQ